MPVRNDELDKQEIIENPTPAPEAEPQPVRELTQTDQLNKRLLQSFLERINQSDVPFPRNPTQDVNRNEDFS